MKTKLYLVLALVGLSHVTQAFCGFYVAKAGSKLFNNRSEVIIVRDGPFSTVTMSSDFNGDVKDFAMVIPVPHVLKRKHIRVVERDLFVKLDNYSAPRLAEYYDPNPCSPPVLYRRGMVNFAADEILEVTEEMEEDKDLGVTIEARYNVDEYDILILSAKESTGLKQWLTINNYDIPAKAEQVLDPYIKSGLKFFVVKVNLNKYNPQEHNGFLRPIQIDLQTEKFMLPIRLGMANAEQSQDMIVYAFSKDGRIESTNYKTQEVRSNIDIPTFIKDDFGSFYKDLFERTYEQSGKDAVFVEYAWNVSPGWGGVKCDPCVGDPPYFAELSQAGVDWLDGNNPHVFFTRLHVRYDLDHFPQDLFFQVTPRRENFQARYVIRHPATGEMQCADGLKYLKALRTRRIEELNNLEELSGRAAANYSDYIFTGSIGDQTIDGQAPIRQGALIPLKRGKLPWILFLSCGLLGLYAANLMWRRYKKL